MYQQKQLGRVFLTIYLWIFEELTLKLFTTAIMLNY